MGKRHKPPKRTYSIDQTPLYKCRSRGRLASILGFSSLQDLEALANDDEKSYAFFLADPDNPKPRPVQRPVGQREKVHLRLFMLLRRIAPPSYLHSGVSGRSNVTNAKAHVGAHPVFKTDIKNFYNTTSSQLVNHFFREQLRCSPDVSSLLTRLCTVNGHIPTGSSLSQLLAFYSIKVRLDRFAAECQARNVVMTIYVDDITISGQLASKGLLFLLKRLLATDGFECHKDAQYRALAPKLITGVIVTAHDIRVRNRQHQKIHTELHELLGEQLGSDEAAIACQRLKGLIASASQIDRSVAQHTNVLDTWATQST